MARQGSKSTSPRAFRARAERVMREAHAGEALSFEWTRCVRVARWFDGSSGFSGTVTVSAAGYRTRSMTATESATGIMVR